MILNDFSFEKIETMSEQLEAQITPKRIKINDIRTFTCDYKTDNVVPGENEPWEPFADGQRWGINPEEHRWFNFKAEIPDELLGKDLELYISSTSPSCRHWEPQMLVYVDGKLTRGMDCNHRYLKIDSSKKIQNIHIYAYSTPSGEWCELHCHLCLFNREAEKLYYNIKAPFEAMKVLDKNSMEYNQIKMCLRQALCLVDWRYPGSESFTDSVKKANEYMQDEFYNKLCGENGKVASCIGHTHIDVAWRWTYAQTREKIQRTFSSVVEMMKKYPEYKFMSSQPQLFAFLKEDAPDVYEEVKELIRQGRFEVEGGMWLEADCNLMSGESFVRQFLHGKRFFKEEFDKDNSMLWLPDVFGYSAAMPQILQKCGINKFVTSKISWNETNRMPHDNFNWYGIDGTSVFATFLTAKRASSNSNDFTSSYTPMLNADWILGSYQRYEPKELNSNTILTFGHGDGGGGPTDENLENYDRLKYGIPGIPKAQMEFAGDYVERIRQKLEKDPKLPKWVGELYLEFHRGTYTSVAKNKKNNRKSEFLYQNAEAAAYMAKLLTGFEYDRDKLNSGWKLILLNQFHDILPGSSIGPVYDKCDEDYAIVTDKGNSVLDSARAEIVKNIKTDGGLVVFNPNSFKVSSTVEYSGEKIFVRDIPAKGYKVVKPEKSKAEYKLSDKSIETKYYIVEFNDDYSISRIFDKANNREVLRKNGRANVIQAYEDYPYQYDAWELSNYYEDKMYEINSVEETNFFDEGECFGFEIRRKFLESDFCQKICFYNNSPRIDFVTVSDWKQEHYMVKAAFDVDVNTDKATYDIQFGNLQRSTHQNTSWDAAKFEVCAHKFMDMAEYGYGVSLMNDCKYGHNVKDGTMKLSLFKCATHPDPDADKIVHSFTYSLYPHAGDFREAGTVQMSYELNNPLVAFEVGKQNGTLPEEYSFVKCSADNFIVETLKMAEDSDSLILRGYEAYNKLTDVELEFGFPVKTVKLCDMMENEIGDIELISNKAKFKAKPFEIITLKIN